MENPGVFSEVGRLREVMVHRPELSLQRLTPENCHSLLFDDVLWVKKARQEHDAFVDTLRERGVEVLEFGTLLAETMADAEARRWLTQARVNEETVGFELIDELTGWLNEMPAAQLAASFIGGIARAELPFPPQGLVDRSYQPQDFVLPPLPNQLFTRDSSCWIGNGVSINSMYWLARRPEALNVGAVYRFHPRFRNAAFETWWDSPTLQGSTMSLEGGDVMPVGNGTVLIGMGERTTPRAVSQLARRLLHSGAFERVIAALMPQDRSFMHLDTIFTFCAPDLATLYPAVVDRLRSFTLTAGSKPDSLRVVEETIPLLKSSGRLSALRNSGSSPRAVISMRPNVNNGMTAITWSPSSPASSSAMTETSIPIPCCGEPVSMSSPLKAPNSVAGAAAVIA